MQTDRVAVPSNVFEGIEAIRRSGKTNMPDVQVVNKLARRMGHRDVAEWIDQHPALYAAGVIHGFQPDEGGGLLCAAKSG